MTRSRCGWSTRATDRARHRHRESREFSNVADEAARVPNKVGRDAEQIIALQPDLVVASPFANADLVRRLQAAHIRLVVADLASSVDAHAENIRFLAYLYGEEARGEALIADADSAWPGSRR